MPPTTILSLPNPLILLIHLHILEYPHANKPEYDHAMFSSSRGLRERMKTMEDVCYFLVGKLEGGAVRTILSTYPCTTPSDSVAFRTSLSKYLEALRHSSVYPSSGNPKSTTAKSKPARGAAPAAAESKIPVAWWWKDVMVRKSLLEECIGEKFERVLLSLSTHTLLKTLKKPQITQVSSQDDIINLIRTQPQIYTDLVSTTQAARHAWARAVSVLLRRGEDLKVLRARLLQPASSKPSKYDSLPTDRLVSLSQAKLNDLLRGPWVGEKGSDALAFLIDAAGVKPSTGLGVGKVKVSSKPNTHPQSQPQPLPIAAAHHPSYVKKLKKPIFSSTPSSSSSTSKSAPTAQASNRNAAKLAFADTLENERRVHVALSDALVRLRKNGTRVKERVGVLEEKEKSSSKGKGTLLWVPPERQAFEYQTEPTPSVLSRLRLKIPEVGGGIGRIDVVRAGLSAWPAVPDLSLPRAMEEEQREGGKEESEKERRRSLSRIPMRGSGGSLPRLKTYRSSSGTGIPSPVSPPSAPNGGRRTGAEARKASTASKAEKRDKKDTKPTTSTSPRKSIRFSIAAVRRKSMFAEDFDVDEEISRIISTAEDTSTESDPLVRATPHQRGRVNRIYTAGTPRLPHTRKTERMSYAMPTDDPGPLPRLVSNGSEFWEKEEVSEGVEESIEEEGEGEGEEEGGYEEAPSVTLMDILLQVQGDAFDLLEDQDGLGEESFGWD